MEHVAWSRRPELRAPVLVAAFTGWNDAGDAASFGVRHLIEQWDAQPFAEIDPEEFYDFQATRPQVRLRDGAVREIVWPGNDFLAAVTAAGDAVLLLGTEPNVHWRTFTEQIVGVAQALGTRLVVTLGALLADVVHRQPIRLIGTSSDPGAIARYNLQRSRYEGPTGIVGVLHDACAQVGLPSVSLWAAVPAYASGVTSPKAALALAQGACELIDTPFEPGVLAQAAVEYERHVETLIQADDDLREYVRRLEEMGVDDEDDADLEADVEEQLLEEADLSADHLMEDIERFLRGQDEGS